MRASADVGQERAIPRRKDVLESGQGGLAGVFSNPGPAVGLEATAAGVMQMVASLKSDMQSERQLWKSDKRRDCESWPANL